MDGMRIDKWLWATRFFKTRALAAHACELNRIVCNGQKAKAAREVRVGDTLQIRNETGDFEVAVLGLSNMRGPAAIAQQLYREDDKSQAARLEAAAQRKAMLHVEGLREGKPSKRDRKVLNRIRGRE